MKNFLKVFVILFALPLTFLLSSCDKQENLSQVSSKESVADLLSSAGNVTFPMLNDKTQKVENVLSVLSEDQIDFALQIVSENLAKIAFSDGERPGWSYQDCYDLALTQYRSTRNVALELFKKDLNELSVEEYMDILDNHTTDLYVNAVSIAPSEKIKHAVWGADWSADDESFSDVNKSMSSCPSHYYGIPSTISTSGSVSCLSYTDATNTDDTDCDFEFKFSWPYNYCPSSFGLYSSNNRVNNVLNAGYINGRLHDSNYVSFLIGKNRIYINFATPTTFVNNLKGDWG